MTNAEKINPYDKIIIDQILADFQRTIRINAERYETVSSEPKPARILISSEKISEFVSEIRDIILDLRENSHSLNDLLDTIERFDFDSFADIILDTYTFPYPERESITGGPNTHAYFSLVFLNHTIGAYIDAFRPFDRYAKPLRRIQQILRDLTFHVSRDFVHPSNV